VPVDRGASFSNILIYEMIIDELLAGTVPTPAGQPMKPRIGTGWGFPGRKQTSQGTE
jgi:hypothetical protein